MNNKQDNHQEVLKKEFSFGKKAIIVFALGLLLSLLIRVLTPPEKNLVQSDFVVKNYDSTKSDFKKVAWLGTESPIPEKLSIFQQNNELDLAKYLADLLISEHNLTPMEGVENYWINENKFLMYSPLEKSFVYNTSNEISNEAPQMIIDEAIRKCTDFYRQYNLDINLSAQKKDIIYLNNDQDHGEVTLENATALQIPFIHQVGEYSLMYQNENNPPFVCRVDNNYQVIKLTFKEKFHQFEPTLELNTISLEEAINNIKDGKASIIYATTGQPERLDLSWIETADLTDFEIEYRFDETTKIAYPFFKFEATITNSSGVTMQAIIITPAVNTQAEKNQVLISTSATLIVMRQHPIPQDITNYKFHLIGNMTLKQFAELAVATVICFIIYKTNLIGFIKWPLIFLTAGLGAMIAFVPIEERPMDHWIKTFFKNIYNPTKFFWRKTNKIPDFFNYQVNSTQADFYAPNVNLNPARKKRVLEYITSIPNQQQTDDFDQEEELKITQLINQFNEIEVKESDIEIEKPTINRPSLQTRVRKLQSPQVIINQQEHVPNQIFGVVVDKAGLAVAEALIEIKDSNNQSQRIIKSDFNGNFITSKPLIDGIYTITIDKDGIQYPITTVKLDGQILQPLVITPQTLVD